MAQQNNIPSGVDVEAIRRFAQSDAGQKLFAALQQNHDPQIRQAMQQASGGDYSAAQRTVSQLLSNEQVRKLMEQFGSGKNG